MNYTSYTAIILSFHHRGALLSIIVAAILSALMYWLFIKRQKQRLITSFIAFVISLLLGAGIADALFEQQPFAIELVTAG